jgi:hypothetical protein
MTSLDKALDFAQSYIGQHKSVVRSLSAPSPWVVLFKRNGDTCAPLSPTIFFHLGPGNILSSITVIGLDGKIHT